MTPEHGKTGVVRRIFPDGRTFEQVRNHYLVEKAIARRLRQSSREERKAIYPLIYTELFSKVPDHPRLREKQSEKEALTKCRQKFQLVAEHLDQKAVLVEFGPGDCRFSYFVSPRVSRVIAVDIADQKLPGIPTPSNFQLVLYDGFSLPLEDGIADVVFSDQFIEHLHPEDAESHFRLVKRILKDKGVYAFRTPHAYFGPHDVSRYFSEKPEGFHLKEWTYSELMKMLKKWEFSSWSGFWRVNKKINKKYIRVPSFYFHFVEGILSVFPYRVRKVISRLFLPKQIYMTAIRQLP
jgi:SAM-dependent methyltransferase